MKDHRKWTAVITYCKNVPVEESFIKYIKNIIKEDKNVLIMIKKEDYKLNPKYTPNEKFQALSKALNEEMKMSKIIISTIPDINQIIERED